MRTPSVGKPPTGWCTRRRPPVCRSPTLPICAAHSLYLDDRPMASSAWRHSHCRPSRRGPRRETVGYRAITTGRIRKKHVRRTSTTTKRTSTRLAISRWRRRPAAPRTTWGGPSRGRRLRQQLIKATAAAMAPGYTLAAVADAERRGEQTASHDISGELVARVHQAASDKRAADADITKRSPLEPTHSN